MKFIHTADLHLDSPFLGLKKAPKDVLEMIYHSTFDAFERIVSDAIDQQIDFMCITGDIFDRDQHSIAAENFFITQCNRLKDAEIPVYLSYGNHDYQAVNESTQHLPTNVTVFGNQVETKLLTTKNHERVAISGFSYLERWINDDQTDQYPSRVDQVDWQIGMLHGSLSGLKTPHENYAPFTLAELLAKNYDYWALGHIHKRQVLNEQPPVIYSGNIQGRHKNESGAKGYYLVSSSHQQLVPEFKAVSKIDWVQVNVSISEPLSATQLTELLTQQVEQQLDSNRFALVLVNIEGADQLDSSVVSQLENQTILARIQSQLGTTSDTYWLYQIKVVLPEVMPSSTSIDRQFWQAASAEVFSTDQVVALADKLFGFDFVANEFDNQEAVATLRERATANLNLDSQEDSSDEDK